MAGGKTKYIVIFGENKLECLQSIFYAWLRSLDILALGGGISALNKILKYLPFVNRYIKKSVQEYLTNVGKFKGLSYEVNEEAIELTLKFYELYVKDKSKAVNYYNKVFNTVKFEAYIKKAISHQILSSLKELRYIHLAEFDNNNLLLVKTTLNKFVINYMQEKHKCEYRLKWIAPAWEVISLFAYYGWIINEFIHRGIIFRKDKEKFKLSKEATWGFSFRTLRDDMFINNSSFSAKDLLMVEFEVDEPQRKAAFKEAKRRGFRTTSIPNLKINVNENFFNLLFFYFFVPLVWRVRLFFKRQRFLFYYLVLFHKRCFPIETFMNSYQIKCHISTVDHDDIITTIVLNKYGTKNVICHWSDLTVWKTCNYAFIAHNIYYVWGNIHYDCHRENYFVDRKVNVGCIYKAGYEEAVKNRGKIIERISNFKKGQKTVAFFDTSVSELSNFLEYLEIMRELCQRKKDINVLFKPKGTEEYLSEVSPEKKSQYERVWHDLFKCPNFSYLNASGWNAEDVIAISDLCINMRMTTPATVALICGRNALYYDQTGNNYHPFARKYKNKIVFEDKNLLFAQIENILEGRFNCRDVISEFELREYDAFNDSNALERLRSELYKITA